MATGLLDSSEIHGIVPQSPAPEPAGEAAEQPAYLTRLATLPSHGSAGLQASLRATLQDCTNSCDTSLAKAPNRPEAARLDQIEHALTILASVVARLAKEAQQSRLHLRATEHDPNLQEDRRVQRELVRSMQARLMHIEERLERQNLQRRLPAAVQPPPEIAEQVSASLSSIRDSLAAVAQRRQRTPCL